LPSEKLSSLISAEVVDAPSATRKIVSRISAGKGNEVACSIFARMFGGAPEIRVIATSIPSAEVPDIRPMTLTDLFVSARFM
jgi:hypothetical protein